MDELAQSKADGETWLKVLDCDGGAAVVDVNDWERRELQVVIRDPNIVNYLATATQLKFGTTVAGNIVNAKGEMILRARVDRGVFTPWDFSSMSPSTIHAFDDRLLVTPRVFVDGPGLRITMSAAIADGFQGECDGGTTSCVPSHYRDGGTFDWYFQSCD